MNPDQTWLCHSAAHILVMFDILDKNKAMPFFVKSSKANKNWCWIICELTVLKMMILTKSSFLLLRETKERVAA
jgi:hypothetical protein